MRRVYARAAHADQRTELMQDWSDHLDQLRGGGNVLRVDFGRVRGKPRVCRGVYCFTRSPPSLSVLLEAMRRASER